MRKRKKSLILTWDFHFASRLPTNLPPVASARDLFCIRSEPKRQECPAGAPPGANTCDVLLSDGAGGRNHDNERENAGAFHICISAPRFVLSTQIGYSCRFS
jgi:hypothetical protein